MNLIAKLLKIKPGEGGQTFLLFCYSFCVTAAVIAGKSARDAFFLTRFDKSLLPLMFVAVAVSVGAFVALDAVVLAKLGLRGRLALLHGGGAGALLLMHGNIQGWVVPVFYVAVEVITVLLLLEFWSMATRVFDSRQAKRLFGLVGGGGSIAAVVMGFSVAPFVADYGSSAIVVLLTLLVLTAGGLSLLSSGHASDNAGPRAAQSRRGPLPRWAPYFTAIAVVVVLAAFVTTIVDYQFKILASDAHANEADLMGFLGRFHAVIGIVTVVIQMLGTSHVISRFGVFGGLVLLPVAVTCGTFGILLAPALLTGSLTKGADQVFKFTVHNAAQQLLWMPVSLKQRRALRPFIHGTLKSVAEGVAGILIFVVVQFVALRFLSLLALGALLAWIVAAIRLRLLYFETLTAAIEKRQIDVGDLTVSVQDPAMVAVVRQMLETGDELQRFFALELVASLPLEPWREQLRSLFREGSPAIRKRVLEVAAEQGDVLPDELVLSAMEGSDELAADAMVITARRHLSGGLELYASRLESGAPPLRAAAARALLEIGQGPVERARLTLARMLDSEDAAEQTAALRRWPLHLEKMDHSRLVSLLASPVREVCEAALAVAANSARKVLIPACVAVVADPRFALEARHVLRCFSAEEVTAECRRVLTSASSSSDLRMGAIQTLREFPGDAGVETLLAFAEAADPKQTRALADSLYTMTRDTPLNGAARQRVRQECDHLAYQACGLNRLLFLASEAPAAELLLDYYRERYQDLILTLFKLRVVEIPAFPLAACLAALRSGDATRLPFALELFDSILLSEERPRLIPLIEPLAPGQRDSHAREIYPDLPANLEEEMNQAVYSKDHWYSAIALDRVLAGPATGWNTLEWSRVPATPLHRELVTRRAGGGDALPETARERFLDEGAELPMYSTIEMTFLLRSVSLFAGIPAETLSRIAGITEEISRPAGTRLFSSGEHGDSLYVVASGEVRIHKGEVELATLGKGACFGEMALLDQSPRSADATVASDATLFKIEHEEFDELLSANAEIARSIMRLLSARLREANEKLAGKRS